MRLVRAVPFLLLSLWVVVLPEPAQGSQVRSAPRGSAAGCGGASLCGGQSRAGGAVGSAYFGPPWLKYLLPALFLPGVNRVCLLFRVDLPHGVAVPLPSPSVELTTYKHNLAKTGRITYLAPTLLLLVPLRSTFLRVTKPWPRRLLG